MIISASLMPHAPILINEIGGKDSKLAQKTISALEKQAENISNSDPETILMISPHALIWPDSFTIANNEKSRGDLQSFGNDSIGFELYNDLDLSKELVKSAKANNQPLNFFDNEQDFFVLDHGFVVPLYFILKETTDFKIIPISYSNLNAKAHYEFGKFLGQELQKSKKRIAIIASGDLSHRLIYNSPAGFSEKGKKFDETLIELLSKNQFQKTVNIDQTLVEDAGECGYRSLLILLGAISNLDVKTQVLSYEGPFGVGYGMVNFKIDGNPSS